MRGFRNILFAILFSVASVGISAASDIYIAQNAAGGNTGADCADAHAVAWLNTEANWGAGSNQIGPGTTVHLCGTISSTVGINGSGSIGSPITILFETGAKISLPAGQAIFLGRNSWITIDGGCAGGCNGVIENTANGTGLANQVAARAIDGSGSGNIEVRNLMIQNFYVHNSPSDTTIDQTQDTCYYANGTGPVSIHDNTMHDMGWCAEFVAYGGTPAINFYNNHVYNVDHGLVIGLNSNSSSQCSTINAYGNHFGPTANWDTTSNTYHHDGLHFFSIAGSWAPCWAFNVYNNLFDGDWGHNNTAHIFTENSPPNMTFYNNVHIQNAGNFLNNGFFNAGGSNMSVYNNTFVGSSLPTFTCVNLQGQSIVFKNNVLTGCNTFVNVFNSGAFVSGGLAHNIYAAVVGGGNAPFIYAGTSESTFANWQARTGQDSAPSSQVSNAELNSSGMVQAGSVVIGSAVNLLGMALTPLNSDTSAGNSRTPSARPSSGNWDVGAFSFNTSNTLPPSGLTAAVQ